MDVPATEGADRPGKAPTTGAVAVNGGAVNRPVAAIATAAGAIERGRNAAPADMVDAADVKGGVRTRPGASSALFRDQRERAFVCGP